MQLICAAATLQISYLALSRKCPPSDGVRAERLNYHSKLIPQLSRVSVCVYGFSSHLGQPINTYFRTHLLKIPMAAT